MQPNCNPIPVPKLVADDMLEVGAVSHIIGGLSSFHFAGPRPIHIQELVMALAAVSLIRPWSLINICLQTKIQLFAMEVCTVCQANHISGQSVLDSFKV